MKRSYYMIFAMLACGVLLTWGLALSSEGTQEKGEGLSTATLSMEEAIAAARTKFPGQVLEAEFEHEDGKAVYEIEIASATGVVREIMVDAQSGELLSSDMEDHDDHEQEKSDGKDDD